MEYRQLGHSGLKVSVLSLGTMTFGGQGKFAKTGDTDVNEARNQIALCLNAGINLFDTADVYSAGKSEEILGQALGSKRHEVLIASKGVRLESGILLFCLVSDSIILAVRKRVVAYIAQMSQIAASLSQSLTLPALLAGLYIFLLMQEVMNTYTEQELKELARITS